MRRVVSFTLNGKATRIDVDEERALLWVLRSDLGLTGTKYGCGEGLCGACTVLVNGEAVRSCATPLGEVEGKRVLTIEGLANGQELHPLQKAWVAQAGLWCRGVNTTPCRYLRTMVRIAGFGLGGFIL